MCTYSPRWQALPHPRRSSTIPHLWRQSNSPEANACERSSELVPTGSWTWSTYGRRVHKVAPWKGQPDEDCISWLGMGIHHARKGVMDETARITRRWHERETVRETWGRESWEVGVSRGESRRAVHVQQPY